VYIEKKIPVYVKEHHHEGHHDSFEGYPWNRRSSSSTARCASQVFQNSLRWFSRRLCLVDSKVMSHVHQLRFALRP
jgi:hypothetical protein